MDDPAIVASGDAKLRVAWYVVRTRSRHEKIVKNQLVERRVETFLPLVERWSRWKDRTKKIAFPLFPGYCFARFSLVERLRVLTAVGVAGLVGTKGEPEPVPDAEIGAIQRLAATTLQYDPHPFLNEGMDVEVVHGPLAGVRGQQATGVATRTPEGSRNRRRRCRRRRQAGVAVVGTDHAARRPGTPRGPRRRAPRGRPVQPGRLSFPERHQNADLFLSVRPLARPRGAPLVGLTPRASP